jgi:hypothetical protein
MRCTASSSAIAGSDAHNALAPNNPTPSAAASGPYKVQFGRWCGA